MFIYKQSGFFFSRKLRILSSRFSNFTKYIKVWGSLFSLLFGLYEKALASCPSGKLQHLSPGIFLFWAGYVVPLLSVWHPWVAGGMGHAWLLQPWTWPTLRALVPPCPLARCEECTTGVCPGQCSEKSKSEALPEPISGLRSPFPLPAVFPPTLGSHLFSPLGFFTVCGVRF